MNNSVHRSARSRLLYDKRRAAKLIALECLLFLTVIILQTSVLARIRPFGGVPDLCFITLIAISFFRGKEEGAVTGIAAGFAVEALGSQGIALLPVIYLFCGYVCGHFTRAIVPKRFSAYLTVAAAALPVRFAVTLIYICLTYSTIHLPQILLHNLLPELLATAVFIPLLYFPAKWLQRI